MRSPLILCIIEEKLERKTVKKRVLVVALYESISEYYRRHLEQIFSGLAIFENYYIENNP